jgi:hypothetical protein
MQRGTRHVAARAFLLSEAAKNSRKKISCNWWIAASAT